MKELAVMAGSTLLLDKDFWKEAEPLVSKIQIGIAGIRRVGVWLNYN